MATNRTTENNITVAIRKNRLRMRRWVFWLRIPMKPTDVTEVIATAVPLIATSIPGIATG